MAVAPVHTLSQSVYGLMFHRFDGQVGAFAYLLFVLLYFPVHFHHSCNGARIKSRVVCVFHCVDHGNCILRGGGILSRRNFLSSSDQLNKLDGRHLHFISWHVFCGKNLNNSFSIRGSWMSIINLKNHLQQVRMASLMGLSQLFKMDPENLRHMLELLLRKGCIKKLMKTPACGKTCNQCQVARLRFMNG